MEQSIGRNPDRLPHAGINLIYQRRNPEKVVPWQKRAHVMQYPITGIAIEHASGHIGNGIKQSERRAKRGTDKATAGIP